jgi:hypothetical protein
VFRVVQGKRTRVGKGGRSLFEPDPMLLLVVFGLVWIPLKMVFHEIISPAIDGLIEVILANRSRADNGSYWIKRNRVEKWAWICHSERGFDILRGLHQADELGFVEDHLTYLRRETHEVPAVKT